MAGEGTVTVRCSHRPLERQRTSGELTSEEYRRRRRETFEVSLDEFGADRDGNFAATVTCPICGDTIVVYTERPEA